MKKVLFFAVSLCVGSFTHGMQNVSGKIGGAEAKKASLVASVASQGFRSIAIDEYKHLWERLSCIDHTMAQRINEEINPLLNKVPAYNRDKLTLYLSKLSSDINNEIECKHSEIIKRANERGFLTQELVEEYAREYTSLWGEVITDYVGQSSYLKGYVTMLMEQKQPTMSFLAGHKRRLDYLNDPLGERKRRHTITPVN